MTTLRMRMDNDLLVRGMAARTRDMLRDEKLAWSTCSIAVHAFRFLYHTTLGRPESTFTIPGPKQPQRLPEILSPAEVRRVLEHTANRKQRAVLATTYGAGLRVSEVVRLQLHHIDAERMSLRVEQGKGAKDRDTLLSPRLLEELRAYWREYRPSQWLFPARGGKGPMDVSTAQKLYYAAKGRAGITKRGGIHALRHYAEFRTMPSRIAALSLMAHLRVAYSA
jgi:integrase